jgi:hypothetical protein
MISIEFAISQIARLANLDDFPRRDHALQLELANALRHAESEYQAQQAIDDWLHDSTEAPKPADIYRILHATKEEPRRRQPNPIDKLLSEDWFSEYNTDEQLAKAMSWKHEEDPALARRLPHLKRIGEQIIAAAEARRNAIGEAAWRQERSRENQMRRNQL